MPYITEIRADDAFSTALQDFAVACDANKVALGLTAPNLANIAGKTTAFATSLSAHVAAKNAAESARETKDENRAAAKEMVSQWAKTFRANPAVSNALLAILQVAPHSVPAVKSPPTVPLTLTATSDGNGNIKLAWKRNGNIPNTQFIIEYQTGPAEAWVQLGTSLKRTFDTTWAPGTYVAFRVIATRRGITSAPSTPFVLWNGESEVALKLAA